MASLKVKAVYEYTSEEPDDLSFPVGQIISITEEIDADWYEGEYTDATGVKRSGIFPNNFVEKYEPEVPSRPSRPTRQKQDAQPAAAPIAVSRKPEHEPEPEQQSVSREDDFAPPVPAISKPQPPPVIIPAEAPRAPEEVRSPPSAISERSPLTQAEPTPAPIPSSAESASAESKKPPPPVAPKSNAFKDRIAAFNQPAAAPVLPFQPQGHKSQPSFIKKPFVAPPPSSSAYVPPPIRQEPVPMPYRREEDPEIKQRQEDDRAAAEAAGFREEAQQDQQGEDEEDAPKPQSLKERIALLQKQQAEQAQRRAGGGEKKEKKPPARKASVPGLEDDDDELERVRSPGDERQSLDVSRDRPAVPSAQRRPQEPMSPLPDAPLHEIISGGEEADQSAAGETTEDDAGTIGPDDSDAKPAPPRRASTAPRQEADVGDEQDTTEDVEEDEEDEDSMDEETRRREELRQRMAKMSGGMGMAGMFGPPGGMPAPGKSAPKKRTSTKDSNRQASGDTQSPTSPTAGEQQRMPMMPIPGMQRVQSPHNEEPRRSVEREREPEAYPISGQRPADVVPDVEDVKPEPLPRASLSEERGAPPPVPRGEPHHKSSQTRRSTRSSKMYSPTVEGSPRSSRDVHHAERHSATRVTKRPISQIAPPVPGSRPPPGPPPAESRPVPPPPPPASAPLSPGPGSESDDEASIRQFPVQTPTAEAPLPIRTAPPPVPSQREAPPQPKRASYFGTDESVPHTAPAEKRSSRVPPIPGSSPLVSPRPPPPPPPSQVPAVPSRQSTDLSATPITADNERGESDYEGDYDTDIASSAKHKDALKAHNRDVSYDGSTTADDTPVTSPVFAAPPPPIHRAVPPPPPQAAPRSRPSMDTPRAPPPAPPQRDMSVDSYGGDYDPYRYNESSKSPPPVPGAIPISAPPIPPREPEFTKDDSSDDMYSASPPRKSMDRPPPPPPTQPEQQAPMPPMPPMPPASQPGLPPRAPPRQSLDVQRTPVSRRSMEQSRPIGDNGQIAGDINLSEETTWWTVEQPLPPALQSRRGVDILSESEESKTSKRGGRTTISKDIYILYIDYSQTIITARYDPQEPENASLEQRHEAPPPKLRQDQLETYWQRFGAKIADTAASLGNNKKDSTVGDGTPLALISDLIKAQPEALHPVGNRAFGALVYANLANASVMQFDEIRAGDIVTLRNAKFEGKHSGPMHQKYKQDLGAGHVAIVAEWDGTRKKVRAWEQGREKAKVRMESFRLGDLKSGEVRVWRVVGREWVGWEGEA